MEELIVKVDGKEYNVKVEETEDGRLRVHCGEDVYEVETKEPIEPESAKETKERSIQEAGVIKAPLPGTIVAVNIKKGEKVKAGDVLIKLVSMKMENEVTTEKDSRVKEVRVKKNDNVNRGDVLVVLE